MSYKFVFLHIYKQTKIYNFYTQLTKTCINYNNICLTTFTVDTKNQISYGLGQ
jgi:hypothetical protein